MYGILGLIALLAHLGQGVLFSYASEKLTRRARDNAFKSIINQEIAYFDEKQNSTGVLTAFLSTDTMHLNSLGGAIFGSIVSFSFTIFGGIILSLVVGWKLALVCSATIPLVAGCGYIRLKALSIFDDKMKKTQEESALYASEVVSSIKTVASLGLEASIRDRYSDILAQQATKAFRPSLVASALYAASQSMAFLCAALGFWYGGSLVAKRQYTLVQLFICFAALISGSQSAGAIFSFAPDISKAIRAARGLKVLLHRKPEPKNSNTSETPLEKDTYSPNVRIDDVSFSYPNAPQRLVLQNLNISVQSGQFIAIVGPSGCGKSTIISLLERFYDPNSGTISVDRQDISRSNINEYRGYLALVSQDTILYQGTIRENLILGAPFTVSEEALIQACRDASIYEFITSLP
jgi:ATP-binding cassette, subfamily B (MDR/TAP), member 1